MLDECLDSILKRKEQYADVEVLVVNNNSSDATLQVCEKYKDHIHNFHSVTETTQGLSFARNRAFKEAKSEWVYYLDDDALVTD
ncbi:MAG TPA: capsular biosynthesis protein CpsI, partial [Flavobacteriales bacterium]|nr:capsular biosynthesis protein CpsI [Flavobacteriales bacterium]